VDGGCAVKKGRNKPIGVAGVNGLFLALKAGTLNYGRRGLRFGLSHPPHTIMNKLSQLLRKPTLFALAVLICGVWIFQSAATHYSSDMRKDRDNMVASLHQAQTPEPQIVAISTAFDDITSNVQSLADDFFSFTLVMLVGTISMIGRQPRHQYPPHSN
jgi:hypothetical protein